MGGNPKDSRWRSPSQSDRRRKKVGFTLSDEARERLCVLAAERRKGLSRLVEDLIMSATLMGASPGSAKNS